MVDVSTKAIVREIGRNFCKTASNMLFGDSHSTPYRWVSNVKRGAEVLGASSGGYKFENQLDRLIRAFQIKGKFFLKYYFLLRFNPCFFSNEEQ